MTVSYMQNIQYISALRSVSVVDTIWEYQELVITRNDFAATDAKLLSLCDISFSSPSSSSFAFYLFTFSFREERKMCINRTLQDRLSVICLDANLSGKMLMFALIRNKNILHFSSPSRDILVHQTIILKTNDSTYLNGFCHLWAEQNQTTTTTNDIFILIHNLKLLQKNVLFFCVMYSNNYFHAILWFDE